jgi:hypothetical protein
MSRRLCGGAALLLSLVLSMPDFGGAQAARIAVTGDSDLSEDLTGGVLRFDRGGNLHVQHVTQEGHFTLRGGPIAIDGYQTLVLTGVLRPGDTDPLVDTGPFAGTFTVRTAPAGQGEVLWEGQVQGQVVALVFMGAITAHGRGPFAGMLLHLAVTELPCEPEAPEEPAECLQLTGWILDPQGP